MILYLQYLPYIKETQTKKKKSPQKCFTKKSQKVKSIFTKKKKFYSFWNLIHERGVQPLGTVVIPTVVYASCC